MVTLQAHHKEFSTLQEMDDMTLVRNIKHATYS